VKISYKTGFLNQSTGSLFKNLVEDLSYEYYPTVLYTGINPGILHNSKGQHIDVNIFTPYNRKSHLLRFMSGFKYVFKTFCSIIRSKHELLFIVSNPPFIGIVGPILKLLRKQKYVILVYDIYPDILVGTGVIARYHPLVKIWRWINRIVYENSAGVITIGDRMRNVLNGQFDATKTVLGEIQVIHNCADENVFKPLENLQGRSVEHKTESDLRIVYSGNFGFTHDFDTILDVAKSLSSRNHTFILVGDGAKKRSVDYRIETEKISNVISRHFYSDTEFPHFISTADIALITMSRGCDDLMLPSKIYISMAVGSALIGITHENSEVARLIRKHKCGEVISEGDSDALLGVLERFSSDHEYLEQCKRNSLEAFNRHYTRKKTSREYLNVLNRVIIENE